MLVLLHKHLVSTYEMELQIILNARPTNINTIAKTAPVFSLLSCSAINSKFVEPVNPYSNEHPYNNKPEDKALNTKIFYA